MNDVGDSVEIMLYNVLKEEFCLVLNQFVYVGDVSGDTSPTIWQRVIEEKYLHRWVKVDQAGRPLSPKQLSILEA